jgi:hypothetical protein
MEEILLSAKQFHAGISSFKESGSVEKHIITWTTSDEDDECIRLLCKCSPKKTNFEWSLQLGIPKTITKMSWTRGQGCKLTKVKFCMKSKKQIGTQELNL